MGLFSSRAYMIIYPEAGRSDLKGRFGSDEFLGISGGDRHTDTYMPTYLPYLPYLSTSRYSTQGVP